VSEPSGSGGPPDRRPAGDGLIEALPGLARIYAGAWWHTAEWTVSSSLHAASRLARSAARGETPTELFDEVTEGFRDYARRLREIVDPDRGSDEGGPAPRRPGTETSASSLRSRGEELLRLSADIDYEEETHPAYERILTQLAPDEARILRLLAQRGPQPAVDIRAGLPLVTSLVAPGRNMIGAEAGCRYPDRVPSYLNNLYRLGLIWFSREPLQDPLRYQVLEAQPDVLSAMQKGGRTARTVRRSIVLTPFGSDFCVVVLPLETGEIEALAGSREAAEEEKIAGGPAGEPGAAPEDGA
jgi:hypothetical protein